MEFGRVESWCMLLLLSGFFAQGCAFEHKAQSENASNETRDDEQHSDTLGAVLRQGMSVGKTMTVLQINRFERICGGINWKSCEGCSKFAGGRFVRLSFELEPSGIFALVRWQFVELPDVLGNPELL